MVAILDFNFLKKAKALAGESKKAPAGESKKASVLRKELAETNDMLLWLLRRIDERNDDSEPPFCPEPDMECRGNCRGCWFSSALDYARRYAHG